MLRLLIKILLLVVLAALPAPALAQAAPRFGRGIVLLRPPEQGLVFVGRLSPDGRYVAGTGATDGGVYPEYSLHLWDLAVVPRDGAPRELTPLRSFDFTPYLGGEHSSLGDGHLAFSPDATRLAVLVSDQILLLSLPEMEVENKLSLGAFDKSALHLAINVPGPLLWSSDGRLLAARLASDGLTVWNPVTSESYRQADDRSASDLMVFGDRWLFGFDHSFGLCTARLENCQEYQGQVLAVAPRARLIVTGSYNDSNSLVAWLPDANGKMQPDAARFDYLKGVGVPVAFSPQERYMTVMSWPTEGNPVYPHFTLWNWAQQKALYPAGAIRQPVWLKGDDYFVDGDGGSLFSPKTSEPVAKSSDNASFPPEWTSSHIRFYHEVWGVRNVSADGTRYLLVVGGTALVIPVIYD